MNNSPNHGAQIPRNGLKRLGGNGLWGPQRMAQKGPATSVQTWRRGVIGHCHASADENEDYD